MRLETKSPEERRRREPAERERRGEHSTFLDIAEAKVRPARAPRNGGE